MFERYNSAGTYVTYSTQNNTNKFELEKGTESRKYDITGVD